MARLHRAAMDVPRPWSEAEFRDLIARPDSFAVVRGPGFAVGRVILDEAELLTLAVAPEARRRGAGRACLEAFHGEALSRGAAHVFLEVAESNRAARALYLSAGYAQGGRRRGYYPGSPPVDALVLRKTLSSSD